MTTIHAKVSRTDCYLKVDGSLTSGMVGVPVSFEFGPEWKGLKKTAVFHAGTVKRDRINIERSTTVPAEVLQKPMENLYIGIYGYREDGTIVIPTVMAKVGMILRGANPSGDPGVDPNLPIWADLERRVSDLEEGCGDAAVKSVNGIAPDENGNVKITIPDSSQNVDLTGYAKETWVQESFQPKGDYLTEHQSLDGYAKTEDIPTKPEDIGAQPAGNYLTEHQDISGKLDKNQGSANVGKILVVGSDGNLTLTDMPEGSVSGDVIGVLDASNNILLSGNLANGTYTLKYENADGTYTDIGTLEVGEAGPAYINLAEPNTTNTTDTTIWCNEARLAATGAVEAKTGYFVSNFVKVSKNQTLRFKNITLHRMGCYNESKTALTNACGTLSTLDINDYIHDDYTTVDGVTTLRIENANVAYIRIAGQLTGTAEDVIITVDQEIV